MSADTKVSAKLHDFQEDLAGRMQRASQGAVPQSLLGIEAGSDHWLVDLADAGEVLPVPAITPVPLTRPWFTGIANVRGALYAVTDLAAFHGAAPVPLQSQARLLLIGARYQGGNTALLVSRTHGLKPLTSLLQATAGESKTNQPWRAESYRDDEGRLWTRLQLPMLLSAAEFLDIAI